MEYDDSNRGRIQHRNAAKQIVDFSGIRYGKITPTDVDGLIEYHRLGAYAFFEFKYYLAAEMPMGQAIALTEMVDDLERSGKHALLVLCVHRVTNPEQDIDAAAAEVKKFYWRHEWRNPVPSLKTLKALLDRYFWWVDRKNKEAFQ